MQLGVSKVKITPEYSVRLAGYANRLDKFEGVLDDIYSVIYCFKSQGEKKILIYGDLLWWGSDFVAKTTQVLCDNFDLEEEQIMFTASHNHSGPGTSANFTQLLEEIDEGYLSFLEKQLILGIKEAIKDMENVNMYLSDFQQDLNVFRRVMVENEIKMRPNFSVEIDQTVTLIKFVTEAKALKGMMVHYPCHANVANINYVNGDYPGYLLTLLDKEYQTTSMFLQGCTGDIRPKVVNGSEFHSGDFKAVKHFGTQLFNGIVENMETSVDRKIEADNLEFRKHQLTIDIDLYLNDAQLEKACTDQDALEKQWANVIKKKNNRNYETMIISEINFANELCILGYNGEMSGEYAKYAKELPNKHILSMGYTNGMIGYIPTAKQLEEGGYEAEGSTKYFALSGKLNINTELKIKNKIKEIMED